MFLRKYVEQTGTGTGEIISLCREWGLIVHVELHAAGLVEVLEGHLLRLFGN